jgi:hypothetical protein
MSRSRILGFAVAFVIFSLVAIDKGTHLLRDKLPSKRSSAGPAVQAFTATSVAAPTTGPTRLRAPEHQPPIKRTDVADTKSPPNSKPVDRLQREVSSRLEEISELREGIENKPARTNDGVHQASETSKSLSKQFDDFAERFVAAVDTAVQNSAPSSGEPKGTRKRKVSLISEELTNPVADQPPQGVVLLNQSSDFLSDDGRITWSREWVFRFSFVMQRGRWHCLGGTCRMVKDDNFAYGSKSPHVGEVLTVPEGTWDDLAIR